MRPEALAFMTMKITVSWDVGICSLVYRYQSFEYTIASIFMRDYSSTLKTEAVASSEMLVTIYQTNVVTSKKTEIFRTCLYIARILISYERGKVK
jgi:hypothetical protein